MADIERPQGHQRQVSSMSIQPEAGLLVDADKALPQAPSATKQARNTLRGWRFGLKVCAWTTLVILICNIILLIAVAARVGAKYGISAAYDGNCKAVQNENTWIHLLINIVSTILLAAATYTMHCLAAPTRAECDEAHARGDWLSIGVLGLRNIWKLTEKSGRRMGLFLVLAASCLPLHLFYNSIIFSTIGTNNYQALVVNEAFLKGGPLSFGFISNQYSSYNTSTFPIQKYFSMQQAYIDDSSAYDRLSVSECVNAYATDFINNYNDLLLVASADTNTTAVAYTQIMGPSASYYYENRPYGWMCADAGYYYYGDNYRFGSYFSCSADSILQHSDQWTFNGAKPSYCLAQRTPQHCQLDFSIIALAVVIFCNLLMAVVMFMLLNQSKNTPTLAVLGDGIASYLDTPDETSKHLRSMDRQEAVRVLKQMKNAGGKEYLTSQQQTRIPDGLLPRRWGFAASRWQWLTIAIVTSFAITALVIAALQGGASVAIASQNIGAGQVSSVFPTFVSAIWSAGPQDAPSFSLGLTGYVLALATPQVLLSIMFLVFTGLLSAMLANHEWSEFAIKRQHLRVTSPFGNQRSSYWLSIPFKYSLPYIIAFMAAHWLLSQTLYLVNVRYIDLHRTYGATFAVTGTVDDPGYYYNPSEGYTSEGNMDSHTLFTASNITRAKIPTYVGGINANESVMSVATSGVASLCVAIIGLLIVLVIWCMAIFRRFKSSMPMVASNSLALASSCYRPAADDNAALSAVQWGEIQSSGIDVPRYGFSSSYVKEVLPGKATWRKLFRESWLAHKLFGQGKGRHQKVETSEEAAVAVERRSIEPANEFYCTAP